MAKLLYQNTGSEAYSVKACVCMCTDGQLYALQSTRTQSQLVPSQLVPKSTRTHGQLVPKSTRTQGQLVPKYKRNAK